MFKFTIFSIILTVTLASPAKISPAVKQALHIHENVNILVSMQSKTFRILKQLNHRTFLTREARLNTIAENLQSFAEASQNSVLSYLDTQEHVTVNSLWISNKISIKGATSDIIQRLSDFEEIDSITEDEKISWHQPVSTVQVAAPEDIQWGIEMIDAPSAWDLGYTGSGVVIGIIDTGVRYTHSSIFDTYREEYGWFDPYLSTTVPDDADGHGTHVAGTIVGSDGIGVAPDATWFACRGCDPIECDISSLQACGQFMLCPTLPNGTLQDCSKAPHIVSNSWGSRGGRNFYDEVLEAWAAAGIIPVFSNGNFGSNSCGTAGSPADSRFTPVIAVGAIDANETLANFTSIGPSFFGTIKPDLAAPGVQIISASFTDDDSFQEMSGSSMSSPHVVGAIALLLSNGTELTYDEVSSLLYAGAEHTVVHSGLNCGNISESEYPNNHVGHGRLNVMASLNLFLQGPPTSTTAFAPATTEDVTDNEPSSTTFIDEIYLFVTTHTYKIHNLIKYRLGKLCFF